MPPFFLFLALGPLSIYLLLIGRINFSQRPFMTTGVRDALALAIATGGLAVVGPLQLFMPEPAALFLGPWVWVPLILLYFFCALLVALLMRPRLVIYNVTTDQLRPVLESVASDLDPQRRWAGNGLVMPSIGVQLTIEPFPSMQNVQLVAVGGVDQDLNGWMEFQRQLDKSLRDLRVQPNPRGVTLFFFGAMMAAMIIYGLNQHPGTITQSVRQLLRL